MLSTTSESIVRDGSRVAVVMDGLLVTMPACAAKSGVRVDEANLCRTFEYAHGHCVQRLEDPGEESSNL